MKNWTLRFRVVDKDNFNEIREGLKWVETRAATDKYKNIQEGDTLTFVCGKDKIIKKVERVNIFKSIPAMLRKYKRTDVMPSTRSLIEMKRIYYSYPGYKEKIKKYGLVSFEIR